MSKARMVCKPGMLSLNRLSHFAHKLQTIDNACATIALLNIVMNVEGISLGDELTTFKSDTQKLKPAYRGKRLGENDFIRNIHNSFAR